METSQLICGAYQLAVFSNWGCLLSGFFEQTIQYDLLLAWHFLLDFLRLLFMKYFFSTQDYAFPIRNDLVNFGFCDLGEMFTDVTSWSLRLFLSISLFMERLSFSKMPVNLIQYLGAVGNFNNRHSARELKYRNLSFGVTITIMYLHISLFFRNSGFLFVSPLTVFLVIKRNTCNGNKNSKTLSFLWPSPK